MTGLPAEPKTHMSGFKSPDEIVINSRYDSAYLLQDVSPTQKVWFVEDNNEVVGGIRLDTQSGKTGQDKIGPNVVIDTITVEAKQRGKGYGKAIMIAAEDWVTNHDLPKTISLAVETDNATAMGLYKSLGYQTLTQDSEPILINSSSPGKKCFIMFKHLDSKEQQ